MLTTSSTLLIRLSEAPDGPLEWTLYDEQSRCEIHSLEPGASLSGLARQQADRPTHLLLPVQKATFRTLTVPTSGYELTAQKLQWLADETLDEGQPVHHWTILCHHNEELRVVGIDLAWLKARLMPFLDAGFNLCHVTLDALALPVTEEGWTLWRDKDACLVRTHEGRACRLSDIWLEHLLAHYRPTRLLCYGQLTNIGHDDSVHALQPLLALYPQAHTVNLLHGRVTDGDKARLLMGRLKKVAVGCVLLAAGVALLTQAGLYWQLHTLEQQLKNRQQALWQSYIPDNPHRNNMKAFLPSQLQRTFPAPLPILQRLHEGMSTFPTLSLEGVDYDRKQGLLRILLFAPDEATVKQFIAADASGLSLRIEKHQQGLWTLRND
ncbi:type II secretion system protein GspL [Enterobacter chuandaensis]|uniref:type II secretion system protein GspL n=1 Tax=Enterobacter chuandaensis TaxID=2497875 RepID=UPI003F43DA1E